MKKIVFIMIAVLFSGCKCMLSQIPPQKVFATPSSCSALLPDYRLKVTVSDNCEISSFTQFPQPGFLLTPSNKSAQVTLKAVDGSGNFRQIIFNVTLIDTVKPVFTIDSTLLSYQTKQIMDIYGFVESLIAETDKNLMKQTWIDSIPGLRAKLRDSSFHKQMLIVASYPKPDGTRSRFITFADTVKLINR